MESGRLTPAGSSCVSRLDPFSLPIRFYADDPGADDRLRDVQLDRDRVVLRRRVRGIAMELNVRIAEFLGVALRVMDPTEEECDVVCITLEHSDPALSIPLFAATHTDDVVAEWQAWARALQRPLLVMENDGRLREPFAHIGQVRTGPMSPRRRRRTAMKRRRPSILLRRRPGRSQVAAEVHRGECEIIARD